MKYKFILIFVCFSLCESLPYNPSKVELQSFQKQNVTAEQKVWNIKLDIYFSKSPPAVVRKPIGADVRLKCEAIMNFTKVEKFTKSKEKIETTLEDTPPEYIVQALMKNVKVFWLKNDMQLLDSLKVKNSTKVDYTNGTIGTHLRIRNLVEHDQGNYTCVIRQNYDKRQTTSLIVVDTEQSENYEIPTYASLFPDSNSLTESNITTSYPNKNFVITSAIPKALQPICQEYIGKVCTSYLNGHFVYIPYNTTQVTLEEKLTKAIQVTKYSNDISSNCEGYAVPSLCYSTFPICRHPLTTNKLFLKEAELIILAPVKTSEAGFHEPEPTIVFENLPEDRLPGTFNKVRNISEIFNFRHNSTILRRVCKQDCEILEKELCQTEYAIAKRHPHIGQQLTLEECQDLPEDDPDCLKIGIGPVMAADDECYWENGSGYLGQTAVASNGVRCIEWSKQLYVRVFEHPELAGRHSYCRNPGGTDSQPWCMIEKEGKIEKQLCDIPKCAHKIWIYIVIVFLLLTLTILGFIICLCYRNKDKNSPTTIRDINLPNADKNIYGNSRLNSPIEMSELLNNQNHNNQPHLTRSVRGNGALRVPQYSLSQIKFLEELGEGAFGKVYKGALKCGGETQYVAVKALKENASAKTQADFRREIDLISELRHDNIVCIVGVALREEPLCMFFEFMARGDLHEFLMGRAPPSGKGLPPMRLLNISLNIASGMHYLASHHYVHRDLAARNCLVSDDFVVKISDFGLSRDIYSSDYYRVQSKSLLPVRWMPPESILYGKFTTESDIWSYGVVLWEIFSYGLQPYYGYSNQEVIAQVRAGQLLAAPAGCPPAVHDLMVECWSHVAAARPRFDRIVHRIESWIESGGCPDRAAVGRGSHRDLPERVPLLGAHCASTGSLHGGGGGGGSLRGGDTRSVCSEAPPPPPPPPPPPKGRAARGSAASLADADRVRDTVVRIPHTHFGNDI